MMIKEKFTTMERPHESAPEVVLELWVRDGNQNDIDVANEVVYGDGYHLARMKAAGFDPTTIVDIGAHIGSFSAFAHALWPKADIVCVEPHPSSFELLKMNCPFAQLSACSVGYSDNPLTDDGANFGGASRNFGVGEGTWPKTLEFNILHGKIGDIDLLKVDCEGAEYAFLDSILNGPGIRSMVGEYHRVADMQEDNAFFELRRVVNKRMPHLVVITDEDRDPESELGARIGPFLAFNATKDRKLFDITRSCLPPQSKA